jgi:hypothetical protein
VVSWNPSDPSDGPRPPIRMRPSPVFGEKASVHERRRPKLALPELWPIQRHGARARWNGEVRLLPLGDADPAESRARRRDCRTDGSALAPNGLNRSLRLRSRGSKRRGPTQLVQIKGRASSGSHRAKQKQQIRTPAPQACPSHRHRIHSGAPRRLGSEGPTPGGARTRIRSLPIRGRSRRCLTLPVDRVRRAA